MWYCIQKNGYTPILTDNPVAKQPHCPSPQKENIKCRPIVSREILSYFEKEIKNNTDWTISIITRPPEQSEIDLRISSDESRDAIEHEGGFVVFDDMLRSSGAFRNPIDQFFTKERRSDLDVFYLFQSYFD